MRWLIGMLAGAALVVALPTTPLAAVKDPAGVKQEREQVRQKIKSLEQEIGQTTDEREKVEKLIELLEKRLEQSRDQLDILDTQRNELETDIQSLKAQERDIAAELAETEARLGEVLRNQYRRQDINPTQAWLAGKSASQAAREGYWFERVSGAERALADRQTEQATRLAEVRNRLEARQARLDATINTQKQRERELQSQRGERQTLMADLNSKLQNQALTKKTA
ncbi:MAG: hypothetical protein HC848_07785 [Limnobacter sp.]|nr:hypothetical protein [Limnobacter sp.]